VSDFYTVVDVTANDRPGLLYDLTHTLASQDLEIFISKATTVLDQVADTFYVKGPGGKKVTEAQAVSRLEDALYEQLRAHFDEEQIGELLILAGWYHAISYFANGMQTAREPWAARFPQP